MDRVKSVMALCLFCTGRTVILLPFYCFTRQKWSQKNKKQKNNLFLIFISLLSSQIQPSIYWGKHKGSGFHCGPEEIMCRDPLYTPTRRGELWQFQPPGGLVPWERKRKNRGGLRWGRFKKGWKLQGSHTAVGTPGSKQLHLGNTENCGPWRRLILLHPKISTATAKLYQNENPPYVTTCSSRHFQHCPAPPSQHWSTVSLTHHSTDQAQKPLMITSKEAVEDQPYSVTCSVTHTCPSNAPQLTWNRGQAEEMHKPCSRGECEIVSILTIIPKEEDDRSEVVCTARFYHGVTSSASHKLYVKREIGICWRAPSLVSYSLKQAFLSIPVGKHNYNYIIIPTTVAIATAAVFGVFGFFMAKKYK